MSTYTDKFGDELEIARQGTSVYIDVHEGDVSAQVAFNPDDAKQIAVDLYAAAGGNDEGPILASAISFNEGVIRLAAIHGKTVEFRYVKSKNSAPETRRFVPESYLAKNGGSFLGPDPDRDNEPRRYRLDRIKGTVGVIA